MKLKFIFKTPINGPDDIDRNNRLVWFTASSKNSLYTNLELNYISLDSYMKYKKEDGITNEHWDLYTNKRL